MKTCVRKGLKDNVHRVAHRDVAHIRLLYPEAHQRLRQVGQGEDGRVGSHLLADRRRNVHHDAIEGSVEQGCFQVGKRLFARQQRLVRRQLGPREGVRERFALQELQVLPRLVNPVLSLGHPVLGLDLLGEHIVDGLIPPPLRRDHGVHCPVVIGLAEMPLLVLGFLRLIVADPPIELDLAGIHNSIQVRVECVFVGVLRQL